jgi:hypothetical protein
LGFELSGNLESQTKPMQAAKQGRVPGDPHYQDLNGDNAITTDDFPDHWPGFPKS